MKFIRAALIPAIWLIPLLCGCTAKPLSLGDGGMLVVIADELDRPILKQTIEGKFGMPVATPHDEPLFDIIWTDGESMSGRTRDPLLILAAPLNGQGPTAALLKRMLTPEVEEGITNGRFSVFTRRNPWAVH
ncbi:MAG TPA: hypothetical protein ENL08_03670, partial [Bacteroidetes bacterium]|nr:hypothetical protein [Bacteroidota bacterium]